MKTQTVHLGSTIVRHELGETWFDGSLRLVSPLGDSAGSFRIDGTDAIVALRDFLNSLDFSGRKLTVVKNARRA